MKVAPVIFETIESDFNGFVDLIGKFAASKKTDPKVVQRFKDETAMCKSEIVHGDFLACNDFDVTERISEISLPTWIIVGEDDRLTPVKYAVFLNERITGSTLVKVPGAGHLVMLEKAGEFNRHLAQFLSRLEG